LVSIYIFLLYALEKKKGLLDHFRDKFLTGKREIYKDLIKIIIGSFIVYMASSILVDKTILFSEIFGVSPFLLSLLGLSIGTNLPELSIALKAASTGKKEIALGDYVGSAAANTLIIGVLSLINAKTLRLQNHFIITFLFMFTGLFLFYYFTRSKNDISRKEGYVLIFVYIAFFLLELT